MSEPRSAEEQARTVALRVMGHDDIDDATDAVLSFATASAAQQTAEWREALWLRHGHEGLYGDDGEMQCGTCVRDFKRDTPEQIIDGLRRAWERQTAALQAEHDSYVAELKAALAQRNTEADSLHDNLAVLRRAVGGALDCLPGCDAEAHEEDCPAADPAEGYRTLERELATLREQNEIDIINGEAWAERAREAERERDALRADRDALLAVAKAAEAFTRLRESGSHPGSGGDPAALKRLHVLQVALAHPVVQRAVKE